MGKSPRDNFNQVVRHERADWIPFTLDVGSNPGFTAPVMRLFREKTGHSNPEEYFNYDFRTVSLKTHFGGTDPTALHETIEPGVVFDEWGVGHRPGTIEGAYEEAFPPLAHTGDLREVELFPTPVIEAGNASETVKGYQSRGYPVFGYAGSIYEWSWWLRGMQQFMMDLLAWPEMAGAVIDKVAGYTKALALQSARTGIDVLCFYDDAGMQNGMQIDPALWRRYIKPRWRDVLDAVRRDHPTCNFFLHSCGKIEAIIPDIIELGFHILHPIQPECMDFEKIRNTYGRDIVLCASISAQRLFPFGTPEEIRQWVRSTKALCAGDNCAVLCPANLVQPETPWENILTFAEEARNGSFRDANG